MIYRLLADVVVLTHFLFAAFAVLGGLSLLRWPRVAWLHVPAVAWAALIEFAGWTCPLTPLENWLRRRGGALGYDTGFIEHYITPVLYPGGLTREAQVALGFIVLLINLAVYGWVFGRRLAVRR